MNHPIVEALAFARGGEVVDLLHELSEDPRCAEVGEDAPLDWLLAAAHRANEDGDYARGEALTQGVLDQSLSDQPARRTVALVEAAVSTFHAGLPAACAHLCQRGLEVVTQLDPPSPVLHAQLEAQRAIALKQQGLREEALTLNLSALDRLRRRHGRRARELRATLHNNIATIYLAQGDDAAGISHFEQGLAAIEGMSGAELVEVVTLLNLGRVLLKAGENERGAELIERGVKRADDADSESVRIHAREALASAWRRQDRVDDALELISEVIAYWETRDEPVPLCRTLLEKGEMLVDRGDDECEPILARAAEIAVGPGLREIETLVRLAQARWFEDQGRFEESCVMHRRHQELQKDLFDQQRSRQVEELRAAYEAADREREAEILRIRTEELEELVQRRTLDLQERNAELMVARDAAQEASRAKSAFLAVVSHELRTPLNAIVGYTELIQDDVSDGAFDEVATDLGRILESAGRLQGLIARILSLTELEAGESRTSTEPLDLVDLLQHEVSKHRDAADRKGLAVDLVTHGDRIALTDPQRLGQIVEQLLSNAVAFTEQGSIQVELTRPAGAIQIAVRDSGIGIAPGNLLTLLDPFSQQDMSYTRTHEGMGLGLALAAAQCNVMGGRLDATSQVGMGSTFTIVLPGA